MATRKRKSPPTPAPAIADLAWIAGLYIGAQEVSRHHDGEKLTPDAFIHLSAEFANSALKEFLLRQPR